MSVNRFWQAKPVGNELVSRLSIIIPFFKDIPEAAFEETLASVLLHRPAGSEILVVNAANYSDPWNVDEDGVRFIPCDPQENPVKLLNQTVSLTCGEIVHILYPGTEVTESWTDHAIKQFDSSSIGIVIPSVYDRRKKRRIFARGVRYGRSGTLRTIRRSNWEKTPIKMIVPHVSAVFFRKNYLQQIGLFNSSFLPQISYVDAALALAESNIQTTVDQQSSIFVCPNLLPTTPQFSWGMQIERLYFRWLGRYHSLDTLLDHFASFFVDSWRHFPRLKGAKLLLGRLCGLAYFGNIFNFFRKKNKTVAVLASEPESLHQDQDSLVLQNDDLNARKSA